MTDTEKACEVLASVLPNRVSYPGSTSYKAVEDSYYSAQAEVLSPSCIIFPESSEDVSKIVETLAGLDVKFAVRGGGHNPSPGAANIDGGVTINMRRMKHVTVDKEKGFVSVGGGAKWGEVYPTLDALNISAAGGRAADVGVGGFCTGGGISFYSGRKGLVCDNVVNFEIVTADAKILQANENENKDLWIALKGGSGSNFGIVTRFDIRTFTQGKFLGGIIITPISTLETQLSNFAHLQQNFDPSAAIVIIIGWAQERNDYFIYSNLQYTQPVEKPRAMEPFLNTQPQQMNTMRISTLSDFTVEAGAFSPNGGRIKYATTCFGGGLSVLKAVYDIWAKSVPSVSSINGANWAIVFQPLPSLSADDAAEMGDNSLGLSPSDGPLTLLLLAYGWSEAKDDSIIDAAAQKLINDVDTETKRLGAFNRYKYLNYAADWQDPLSGYGEASLQHLRAVSKKYDPAQLFQRNCPGGFKIPRI